MKLGSRNIFPPLRGSNGPAGKGQETRGFTMVELIMGAVIVGFITVVLYKMLSFGVTSFKTGGTKLSNLQDASLLTLRLKRDIHSLAEPVTKVSADEYSLKVNKVNRETGEKFKEIVTYKVVGTSASDRVIERAAVDSSGVSTSRRKYGKGNYEQFSLDPIKITVKGVDVEGYKVNIKFQSEEEKGVIDFNTAIFPRNVNTAAKGDTWNYLEN